MCTIYLNWNGMLTLVGSPQILMAFEFCRILNNAAEFLPWRILFSSGHYSGWNEFQFFIVVFKFSWIKCVSWRTRNLNWVCHEHTGGSTELRIDIIIMYSGFAARTLCPIDRIFRKIIATKTYLNDGVAQLSLELRMMDWPSRRRCRAVHARQNVVKGILEPGNNHESPENV